MLDLTWELQPNYPRYSNFKDTTTYFVHNGGSFLLQQKGFIQPLNALDISEKLSAHILKHIVDPKAKDPLLEIKPYEGTDEEINLIFPRPAETIFHKAHMMTNMIRLHQHFKNVE